MKITLNCICDLDNEDFCSEKSSIIRMLQADKAFFAIYEIKAIMRDVLKYPQFEYDEKTTALLENIRDRIYEVISCNDLVDIE